MDKQTLKALGKGLRQRWPVEDHLPLDIQIQLLRLVAEEGTRAPPQDIARQRGRTR